MPLEGLRQRFAAETGRSRLLLGLALLTIIAFTLYPSHSSSQNSPSIPKEDYTYPAAPHRGAIKQDGPKRVAIIGAGASGSASAFFLNRAARIMEARIGVPERSLLGEIVMFDREGYVGGRSTTVYPHGDQRTRPVESGASIFVDANQNLCKAAKYFNLTTVDPDFGESGVAIWDGSDFLYTTSTTSSWYSSWYDSFTAVRRYGIMSPYRTSAAVKSLLLKFANLYNPTWLSEQGAARSIEEFAERMGLGEEFTTRWAQEWVLSIGIGEKWMGEIMEGSTRCNYAADMNGIHALGASVSMATGGAKAVEGGNWQIFEAMVRDSKVALHLGTEVTDIIPLESADGAPLFQVLTSRSEIDDSQPFDQIFYAAPWYNSPRDRGFHSLEPHLMEPIPHQKYVRLHVTLFTTSQPRPLPSFFGLPDDTVLPTTILTTSFTARSTTNHPPPRFQSISWHPETFPGSGEYVVKIFSRQYIKDKILHDLIGEEPTWLLRKEWYSYPVLDTISSYAPVEPVKGVQYLAALEPWVSTMETQTLSGREAVARVVEDWWGLGMGECKGGADAWDWTCSP